MKNTLKTLLAVGSIAAASSASAVMIKGDIGINLAVGADVAVDTTANTVDFTSGPNGDGSINFATGDFAGMAGSFADYADFTYDAFTGPTTIWSVLGTPSTSFTLTSITYISETATGVTLEGRGFASMAGFDTTGGDWSFSSDQAGNSNYNFSSTTSVVPDSGATLALLGLGLVSVVGIARRYGK